MTPGLAGRIKNSTGEEQQAAIEQAGGELRAILKKRKFSGIKSPLHPADAKYLSEEKGLGPGNLIIPLAGGFVPNFGPKPRVGSEGEERELGRGSGRRAFCVMTTRALPRLRIPMLSRLLTEQEREGQKP